LKGQDVAPYLTQLHERAKKLIHTTPNGNEGTPLELRLNASTNFKETKYFGREQ
jgi:hypothetical protein